MTTFQVEPFDRLPQLICKKCESILKDHHKIKKNFKEKQEELKNRVQDNAKKFNKLPSSPLDESKCHSDDSDDEPHDSIKRRKKPMNKKFRKRIRHTSSSCDELDHANYNHVSDNIALKTKQNCYKSNEEPKPWKANLSKHHVCRICSQRSCHKKDITKHLNQHSGLIKKYDMIFKKLCVVVLDKIDKKPNIINSNQALVYDLNSIIEQNKYNPNYYTVYQSKNYSNKPNKEQLQLNKNESDPESTDDEVVLCKRRRLLSRSSSDTVVITQHSENEDASRASQDDIIDCIDINDSSDNETCENYKSFETYSKNSEIDNLKCVQDVIKMCNNRYSSKKNCMGSKNSNNKVKEVNLHHKVLSIGIKIINNKGFNCTGLLRFTQQKDLRVIWQETSIFNASADTKYVRISTKMKRNVGDNANKIVGWENIKELSLENHKKKNINFYKKLSELEVFVKCRKPKVKSVLSDGENSKLTNLPCSSSVLSHLDLEICKSIDSDSHSHKLLNTNPVSNPRQLPKKFAESCIKITKVFSGPNQIVPSFDTKQTDENSELNINTTHSVTSAVSITPTAENIAQDSNAAQTSSDKSMSNNSQQTLYPRIKVKPVSELMPENTTNNINTDQFTFTNQFQNVLACNNNSKENDTAINKLIISNNKSPSRIVPFSVQKKCQVLAKNNVTQFSNNGNVTREYIWLHTPELPNMKTNSPFHYVKNLLLIHNITLLDADAPLPPNSISLVKLNLAYNQENCRQLTLSLLLFYCRESFCIKVRDEHQKDVSIKMFSANWQWLLLKVYNKDVINEVLKSAVKINAQAVKNAQTFINLINSIQCSQDIRHT